MRYYLWAGVHLSVRPSVTLVYYIQTARDIVKLFSRPGVAASFLRPSDFTQFQREPPRRRRYIHGDRKNLRFSIEIAVYLGNDGCYGMLIGSHGSLLDPCLFRLP